jgi:hypothetical protein
MGTKQGEAVQNPKPAVQRRNRLYFHVEALWCASVEKVAPERNLCIHFTRSEMRNATRILR